MFKANNENPDETAHKEPSSEFQCLQMYVRFHPMSEISRLYSTL